ncbi:hypothetical protein NDU88_000437 [Pleurodeles waltl]|uniref:Uncharacterized protein n=1 Tax=Pleurodeles waltl TaxID=8319 RepID=A0AAV7TFU4_PLEWA|nr:hypothetical protein NDU88_000437 [Pleurodeles waltl]
MLRTIEGRSTAPIPRLPLRCSPGHRDRRQPIYQGGQGCSTFPTYPLLDLQGPATRVADISERQGAGVVRRSLTIQTRPPTRYLRCPVRATDCWFLNHPAHLSSARPELSFPVRVFPHREWAGGPSLPGSTACVSQASTTAQPRTAPTPAPSRRRTALLGSPVATELRSTQEQSRCGSGASMLFSGPKRQSPFRRRNLGHAPKLAFLCKLYSFSEFTNN